MLRHPETSPPVRQRAGRGSRLSRALLILGLAGRATAADAPPDLAEASEASGIPSTLPSTEGIEEIEVRGDPRPTMDVLAGASVTRVSADDALRDGLDLRDALSDVPGLQIRQFGGAGESFELSIRGSSPRQVPVLLDGIRIESVLTNQSDLSTLCLDLFDEIHVTRGAGAARAGSGAIGGVVELRSRPPGVEPETRVRVGGGHFGTVEGSLRHARRIGAWNTSGAYCGFHTDGDYEFQRVNTPAGGGRTPIDTRLNNEADRHAGLLRFERDFEALRFRFTQATSYLSRGTPGIDFPQRTAAHERNWSSLSIARADLPVRPPGLAHDLEATLLLAHRYERNAFRDPIPLLGFETVDTTDAVHSVTGRGLVAGAFSPFGLDVEASVLAEGRLDTRGSNEANRRTRLGGALRAEASLQAWQDRLRVSPSLRIEHFEGADLEWIPGLFVEVAPLPALTLRASASRSYRVPAFGELFLPDKGFVRGNPNLDPESAWNFEVGGTLRSPFTSPWLDFEISANGFWSETDDSIVFALISPQTSSFVNTGATRIRGHELSVRWQPHDWVKLSAARTVTRAEEKRTGVPVVGVARSQIDARLVLGPPEWLRLVAELHYTGDIPASRSGRSELRSRVVYDASASIDLAHAGPLQGVGGLRALWLAVRGRNLGNVAVRDAQFFPRPGRNVFVSLEGTFR